MTEYIYGSELTSEQLQLFNQWRRLAFMIARRWARIYHPAILIEDFESFALIGLYEAVQTFDAAKGIPFVNWAGQKIKWKFLQLTANLRKEKSHRFKFIDHAGEEENGEPRENALDRYTAEVEERTSNPHDHQKSMAFDLLNYIRTAKPGLLTATELTVLRDVYIDGKSLTEISKTRQASCATHKKALRKLRKFFGICQPAKEARLPNTEEGNRHVREARWNYLARNYKDRPEATR